MSRSPTYSPSVATRRAAAAVGGRGGGVASGRSKKGLPRAPRRSPGAEGRARRSTLERRFLCSAVAAICAILCVSYASFSRSIAGAYYNIDGGGGGGTGGGDQQSSWRHWSVGDAGRRRPMDAADNDGNENNNALRGVMKEHPEQRSSGSSLMGHHGDVAEILPSYFVPVDERRLHEGRVVRELSHRVLSRHISQSNVVVVAPDVGDEARVFESGAGGVEVHRRQQLQLRSLPHPARVAIEEGHATHVLPASVALSDGWDAPTARGERRHYDRKAVSWILLAYFSTAARGTVARETETIDDVLSPSRAGAWLNGTTVTYVVFPVRARASIPLSSVLGEKDYEYEADYTVDRTVEVTGLVAAGTLLGSNYRLQLLSSSHHFDPDDGEDGVAGGGGGRGSVYGPNALFASRKALHRFLYDRASRALGREVEHARRRQRGSRRRLAGAGGSDGALEVEFHSLIFATQGLDLAIPARSSYTDLGAHRECYDPRTGGRKERCDPKLNARALNESIFIKCPERHGGVDVQFVDGSVPVVEQTWLNVAGSKPSEQVGLRPRRVKERTGLERSRGIMIDIDQRWLTEADVPSRGVEVWMGNEDDPEASEAACVRFYRDAVLPRVACRTRIVPKPAAIGAGASGGEDDGRPNLLFVMIDPLSRDQLKRSLPNTWAMLSLMGFVDFERYTAVGNNSGPNQAALYSGAPLSSRQGIRSDEGRGRTWIWDRLNDAGYVTLKAEDGCVSNSNMVQSIQPKTHHGRELHEMFCFSFDRPNCLGSKLAADHLVTYAKQFVDAYNRGERDDSSGATKKKRPWAAFLSFIDSHEDSSTLISYLDGTLLNFLQDMMRVENTLIVFTSDHGLHYGPQFATKSGEVERAKPVLFLRLPTFAKLGAMGQNRYKFTTAFDVHETLLDLLSLKKSDNGQQPANEKQLGMSLVKPLPKSRVQCSSTPAIPQNFCSLLSGTKKQTTKEGQCTFMRDPPSVFSFYSDIPQKNRPIWPDHCPARRNHEERGADTRSGPCSCATNSRGWFGCSNMTRSDFRKLVDSAGDHFSLRSCSNHDLDQSLEFDIHVKESKDVVSERASLAKETARRLSGKYSDDEIKASFDAQPNIIFLEIDSVSLSYAERFFPLTWSLLNEHKIVTTQDGSECPSGFCAGVFNKTSVVGQSSIVNQLAALSGCVPSDIDGEKLQKYTNRFTSFCPLGGDNSIGVDTETEIDKSHWIFELAKNLGYITFFGEEFCYEDSPYVVQTQSAFKLDVDLSLSELYCHLAKHWLKTNDITDILKTWAVEYDSKTVPDTCFDGKSRGEIGLEFISQMWDAYDSRPKFAFLNALAAHDYSLDAAHVSLGAEGYDAVVHRFLRSILARKDSRDTYVVLRSDHGLQGGPYPIDYSTQIEHMHPWTAIIAPANHQSVSVNEFASNQQKLATGFDLYHSLRYLMSPLFDVGIPRWSYNLFQQTIPTKRSCKDAKIPIEFCPCTEERTDMAPSFYVGHSEKVQKKLPMPALNYDWRNERFVAPKLPGVLSERDDSSKYSVDLNENVAAPKCNATLGSYINEEILQDSWRNIDNITALYPGAPVSGGIFLYPRQTTLLTYLIQKEIASRAAKKKNADGSLEPFRVCETGYGSGHSAALFLSAAPNVEVVSFDKHDRPYQVATFLMLRGLFGPKRITRVIGDSCNTVRAYNKPCDFVHGSSLCKTDNIDLVHKTKAGVTLTSTAMDSLQDNAVYFGKDAQWRSLLGDDCIENVVCFKEEERTLDARLHLARGKEQVIAHEFCFAANTGRCGGKSKAAAGVAQTWQKNDFCPAWIIEHPV